MRGSLGSEISLLYFAFEIGESPLHFEEGQVRMSFTLRAEDARSKATPDATARVSFNVKFVQCTCIMALTITLLPIWAWA